jgi:hypothetical protein
MSYSVKHLIIFALTAVTLTSCCVIPERGVAYSRISYYERVRARKNPIIYLEREYGVRMYYNHRRKQVWYECAISNESKDTLVFNISDFYMCSNNMELPLKPIYYNVAKPNTNESKYKSARLLKLAPGATINTVFSFDSKNKISRQEYNDHLYSDSVYLVYSDKTIKDTILSAISLKREG